MVSFEAGVRPTENSQWDDSVSLGMLSVLDFTEKDHQQGLMVHRFVTGDTFHAGR